MEEPADDDIAQWAAGLTPDGSPGLVSQRMREFLGDSGYEKAMAEHEAATAMHLQRQTLINNLLTFGVVGLVASVTLLIQIIFN
jgi:hypothetical protein